MSVIAAEQVDSADIDEPWPLPEGWAWAKISDVTSPASNVDPCKLDREVFTYVDLSAIESGRIQNAQSISVADAPSRAKQLVEEGDTLYSCVRVYLKNIAFVTSEHHLAIASTAYCVLRPRRGINPRYLFWFVNWQKFTSWTVPLQRGNSPPAVVDSDVRSLPFPVPPPPEQDRIVARIDELFAEITEGETALQRARSGLDTWRQTLLKAAITGELTSDWREANKAAGTADEVLAKIRLEKDSGDPVTRRGRRTSTQAAPDLNSLHELPSCWRWARMSDVTRSDTRNGISIGDYPVLDFLA